MDSPENKHDVGRMMKRPAAKDESNLKVEEAERP